MARFKGIAAAAAAAMMITFAGAGTLSAQDATPTGDMSPNPEECTVTDARTVEELQAIYGEPAPEGAGEATSLALNPTPAVAELPTGEPADEATVEAITAAVRMGFACFNAGDHLRGFSNVTDEFLVSQVGLALFDEDFVAVLEAEAVPLAEDQQTEFYGVRNVIVLEDGRVGALVDYMSGSSADEGIDGFETDFWIYENVDGAWLLDESFENLETTNGPEATPAA